MAKHDQQWRAAKKDQPGNGSDIAGNGVGLAICSEEIQQQWHCKVSLELSATGQKESKRGSKNNLKQSMLQELKRVGYSWERTVCIGGYWWMPYAPLQVTKVADDYFLFHLFIAINSILRATLYAYSSLMMVWFLFLFLSFIRLLTKILYNSITYTLLTLPTRRCNYRCYLQYYSLHNLIYKKK